MKKNPKKEKALYITAAVLFVFVAVGLMILLLNGSADKEEPEPTAPAATAAPTATPQANLITIAGKTVDPETDSFDLSGKTLTAEDCANIARLKNLVTLSLTKCQISDLSFVSGLDRLMTLYLPENAITDLRPLSGLGSLRTLYLDKNPLTDLTPLTGLGSLTTLSIKGVPIADYVLEDMQAAMPSCKIFSDTAIAEARPVSMGGLVFTEDVEYLDLSDRGIADIGKLSYCLMLKDLNLAGNPVDSIGVLPGLPRLEVLSLARTGLNNEKLDQLKAMKQLLWLDISGNEAITADKVDELKLALPDCEILHDELYYTVELGGQLLTSNLTAVMLPGCGITDISPLEKFYDLQILDLSGNSVTGLSAIGGLTQLTELNFSYNAITDISPLSNHGMLEKLNLSNNAVRDVYPLSSCGSLKELDLSYNDLDYVTDLTKCKNLLWIDLTGNPSLTAEQIVRLQYELPNCTIVTDLDISTPEPTPEPTVAPAGTEMAPTESLS